MDGEQPRKFNSENLLLLGERTGQNTKIPKKQRQLLKQVPTRKPARKGKGERGQRGLHLLPGITALLEDDPKNSAKRDGGKK